jgi:hypothetical protein
MATKTTTIPVGLLIVAVLAGCETTPPTGGRDPEQEAMLALLMPSRIEIVEPFTRVKSFDGDTTPDGIELFLRAVNALDNPGLMIVGEIRVELYEHVPASGSIRGRRLEHWNIELSTVRHQRTHWNQLTQMYEFRLRVDPSAVPFSRKYVLVVTYNSPLGEHLVDEFVIQQDSGGRLRRH